MKVTAVVGGTVVTPDGPRRADVLISDGKIAGLTETGLTETGLTGAGLTGAGLAGAGRSGGGGPDGGQKLDAAGCYVLPGGVDPHCHLMAQVQLATAAAARGGTTTVLSFTNPDPGQGDLDCLHSRRAELDRGGAVVDVGLHAMLYDPEHAAPADLAAARRAGAAAVKVFLAYPELGIMCSPRRLFELMADARRAGLLVQVHCESGPLIEALVTRAVRDRAARAGSARAGSVRDRAARAGSVRDRAARAGPDRNGAQIFSGTRPPEVEEEAVASALAAAALAGAPCYLVHLSSAGAIEQVRLARRRRRPPVYAEVCLHHLVLDDRRYAGADAGRYLVAPPLRSAEHIEALWEGVADGTIDAVGSDHCQTRSAVTGGIPAPGESYQYGLAGIGARLPLLLSEGMARGVPVGRLVRLLSENPARIFGHYPRKGALAPGSDADVVVFDPSGETVIGADDFDDGTGASVYAGLRRRGRVRAVLLRGQLTVTGGMLVQHPGRGRYQPAGQPSADRRNAGAGPGLTQAPDRA